MTLRCKQGDLAVIVKSYAGNEGKIVRCIEFLGSRDFVIGGTSPAWRIDRHLKLMNGNYGDVFPDFQLRPIRPSEGQDETLEWAPVSEKEVA